MTTTIEAATASVMLHVENTYDDGGTIVVLTTAEVTLPVPDEGTDERSDWEYEQIYQRTGTGREDGDSWYDVEIIQSTAPELLGMKFEFGY